MWALGLRLSIMGKHTAFRWPVGAVLRWMDVFPVDRNASGGTVQQVVEQYQVNDKLWVGISPEGTRRRVVRWKSGFQRIAVDAGLPILPAVIDYGQRELRIGDLFWPTDNREEDIRTLQAFLATGRGRFERQGITVQSSEEKDA
jgi:1-acyl-sn-glycerol-3-phosphate acyltransferase